MIFRLLLILLLNYSACINAQTLHNGIRIPDNNHLYILSIRFLQKCRSLICLKCRMLFQSIRDANCLLTIFNYKKQPFYRFIILRPIMKEILF